MAANTDTKAHISFIEYGKGNVRITKVRKDTPSDGVWQMREVKAAVLLQGDFVPSFVHADNSLVVPTDTCKNTIYYLSKDNLNDDIEAFGIVIARHFLREYAHVAKVRVQLEEVIWKRMSFDGKEHTHAFQKTMVKRLATVESTRTELEVTGGFDDVRVMKTTGSGFTDYHRCKLTTLQPVVDRILSTNVTAKWTYCPKAAAAGQISYSDVHAQILDTVLSIFANTYSKSVQATMWEIGRHVIDHIDSVNNIYLNLPNLHNWYYDLERFGVTNDLSSRNQVFFPTDEPNGVIRCIVSRKPQSKL